MRKSYQILEIDPYLWPFAEDIELRMNHYEQTRTRLLGKDKRLSSFANGHLYFGFHQTKEGWVYREWAPNAEEIYLIGDFNGWNRTQYRLDKLIGGSFEILIPGELPHGSRVKIQISANGNTFDRIPLYCRRVVQNPENNSFDGVIWCPSKSFVWSDKGFRRQESLFIYEAHVGMSGERERVTTFTEFTQEVLPRIQKLGYNTVQIMAIMEHPYYGSFGYQVSNFFAVSSRFGTPEELKVLVDTAHSMGLAVIMDIVHAHAAKNTMEGIGEFDGTDYQFFHSGGRGEHPAWGTKLFDYHKPEVLHFLLSNVKYWLTEYHLDGFRFDGVTSMLYHSHGLGTSFDNYHKYFSLDSDLDAVAYLQLAAEMCKEVKPDSVLIAEDMSGLPGMCLPVTDGGLGFDYRLGMGLPDFFIKLLKERKDEDWHMGELWNELTSRRPKEKVIAYCESHDQALVGDKTIIFWLADKEMYWQMGKGSHSEVIDRAMSMHKMIRLLTCAAGGDGYLNFMGNEFGHPEWIDFPREGNGWSYYYARRQWSLADNSDLRYSELQSFDAAMIHLTREKGILTQQPKLIAVHEDQKTLAFERGGLIFLINFHPEKTFTYKLSEYKQYKVVLHTAWDIFGGHVDHIKNEGMLMPAGAVVDRRSAMVLERTFDSL